MAPRASKPSLYLKKCSIAVIGSLGKDAKLSDVEKWTVNNGGTFNSKITPTTTHVICSWDTYMRDNFALPKTYADKKKLQFVKWGWLEETLHARRIRPTNKYLHPRDWESKVKKLDKKAARRQALLTGKSMEEVESAQSTDIDEKAVASTADTAENFKHRDDSPSQEIPEKTTEEERVPLAFDVLKDENGVTWKVDLKGSELPDPEDGDYILTITISNGKEKYYKAQYEYLEGNDKPLNRLLGVGSTLKSVRTEFATFYKTKVNREWAEHYDELKSAAQSIQPEIEQHNDNETGIERVKQEE